MKRCKYLKNETSPNIQPWKEKFKSIEGIVVFSEGEKDFHRISNLTLKLKEYKEGEIIMRGVTQRINVGEKVKIYYDSGVEGPNIFCEGYEILDSKGNVVYRYVNDAQYRFVD